jgi:ssDNA-binding Zn-finger/Zn-ribbon topoisomerase 1
MTPKRKGSPFDDIIWGDGSGNAFDFSDKPKRDSRRAFTETQKKAILHQQDYKCARCHKKLDLRATQFDHKKPWASGGPVLTFCKINLSRCKSIHPLKR